MLPCVGNPLFYEIPSYFKNKGVAVEVHDGKLFSTSTNYSIE
jgi:hypothetical protein